MDAESVELLARFRDGDPAAADALYFRFAARLAGLARKRLPGNLGRRLDAEDVVQSVYRSFFAGAQEGQYCVERSGDLWRLLAAITVNKVRQQVEFHGQLKRNVGREVSLNDVSDSLRRCTERFAADPGDSEALAVAEELEALMSSLPERDRTILELRLNGRDVAEIAEQIGRSEWTVRRSLNALQKQMERRLLGLDG